VNHINPDNKYKPLIFIAEDEPVNLQVLYNILKKGDYRMAAAGNGKKALAMIPESQPDLILLDIMMPGMDGFEVCEHLKKIPETKDIPVIFLTARVETPDVIKGFDVGAVDYVTKPFKGAELLSRIKTHLELKFARESLKELNATKDKLFSIIAHDLRNPLQVLMFSADLLSKHYEDFDEDKKKEFIDKIFTGTNQISDLLENLLEWARSQRGIIESHVEKIYISTLAEENVSLFKEIAKKKEIRLFSEVDTSYFAIADRNMIRIVIRNLVSNAIKFTFRGGEVKISASASQNSVQIDVTDTGVGIAPEDIHRLFKIDKQKITPGTAKEKGSGLGLILCKEFVEKNNGTIDVVSTPGKGTCFSVTLPLKY
jgi:two-component system sensor histidine kinase/response regulator